MPSPLDVSVEIRDYPGAAVSLSECGVALWPHQTELVSIATESHQELAEAIEACRGFVVVPAVNPAAGDEVGDLHCLARVTMKCSSGGRLVLVVRGLCRAEISNRFSLPAGRELLSVRLRPDVEPAEATIHRENRHRELLETAATLIPGPLPIVVSSFLIDRVPLGPLCDLLAGSAGEATSEFGDSNVDTRSDAVLAGLRRRSRLSRSVAPLGTTPLFSEN